MPALMAIFDGNSTKLKRSMDDVVNAAQRAGMAINTNLNPKMPAGQAGVGGLNSSAIREILVLMREMGRGDLKRAAGSASLLAQNLGIMPMLLNPITLSIAALGAGIFAAYKFSDWLVGKLTGLKLPEFHPEYIAMHLQKMNLAIEAQRVINKEIERSIDLYNSAAKAAGRVAEETKLQFEHTRKIHKYEEEKELRRAATEQQKADIRAKYAALELKTNSEERAAEIRNKQAEQSALEKEGKEKKRQADAISVASKENDQNDLNKLKQNADAQQKFLDDEKAKDEKEKEDRLPFTMDIDLGITKATQKKKKDANDAIQAYHDAIDRVALNDVSREQKEYLNKQAGSSSSQAATMSLEIQRQQKLNEQKSKDEQEEIRARLEAEAAKDNRLLRGHLTRNQQMGAYVGPATHTLSLVDINKRMEKYLHSIDSKTVKVGAQSGVRF